MVNSPPLPVADLEHIIHHTRELWAEASGKSFFITGGTGFFGMWLLESFARVNDTLGLGMQATVLTRDPVRFAAKAPHLASRRDLTFMAGDIRSFAFPQGTFPYIIHAATEASATLNKAAPQEMLDAIVGGTRRTLDFAAQAGTKKFLLTSSGAVYGPQPAEVTHIAEDFVAAPFPLDSAYGEGKRIAEHLCAVHSRQTGCETKIARCFAFVGPYLPLDAHFAIGNFIRDAMSGGPIHIGGDGTPMRSYLYASDLAIWLWTMLFQAPSGRAYNVGSAADLSIAELAATVSKVTGNHSAIQIARPAVAGSPVSRYVPSVERARTDLGLQMRVPLEEAIQKTIKWYQT